MRPEWYKQVVTVHPGDYRVETIKTSCGVFVRGILAPCGLEPEKSSRQLIGKALVGGWVPFDFSHPAWVDADVEKVIPDGAIFYRAYSKRSPGTESHVGIIRSHIEGGTYRTAEGGGSDPSSPKSRGTVCRLSAPEGKDVFAKDSLGRVLVGWWDPEKLGLPESPPPEVVPE
jgi:hypothetical protein